MGYKQDFITHGPRWRAYLRGLHHESGRPTPYFVNTGNYRTASISTLGTYYAACVVENVGEFDLMYGPAYKGTRWSRRRRYPCGATTKRMFPTALTERKRRTTAKAEAQPEPSRRTATR